MYLVLLISLFIWDGSFIKGKTLGFCIGGDHLVVSDVKKQTLALMTAALAFVAGLAWKDAISAWLAPLVGDGGGEVALTISAVVVTVVVVLITIGLTKFLGSAE